MKHVFFAVCGYTDKNGGHSLKPEKKMSKFMRFIDNLCMSAPLVADIEVYMSAYVLLNLLEELRKRDKMRGLPSILSLFLQ